MKRTVKPSIAPEHTHKRRLFVWPSDSCVVKEGSVPCWGAKKKPAFLSLFSGAMGLDLGLESAGLKNVGCLELDKWACKTIRKNRPDLPLVEDDIRNWSGAKLLKKFNAYDIQLVCGGPPCPSFSTAGRRQSFGDPRGEVMFDFLRVINEIRPPFFIMENVRGILSAAIEHVPLSERPAKGKAFTAAEQKGSVLRLLKEEFGKMRYTVTVELVNAADYGVPQKRERVVFIGSRDGFQVSMPPPMFVSSGDMFTPRWRTLADALAGLHEDSPEIMPFSAARAKYLRMLKEGQNWRNLPKDILREAMGGAYASGGGKVGFYRRLSFDRPCPTVSTSPVQKSTCLCHPTELRPLSVREYARIQQFPDDWIFEGSIAEKYRQIGNAVPVGLGHQIGRSILKYIVNYENLTP